MQRMCRVLCFTDELTGSFCCAVFWKLAVARAMWFVTPLGVALSKWWVCWAMP